MTRPLIGRLFSLAVDKGSTRGHSEKDYGGRPRVCGGQVDFGAFEYVKQHARKKPPRAK